MTLPLVARALSTRRPEETLADLHQYVTREVAPTLQQLRLLFNELMVNLNGDDAALDPGILEIGGVSLQVSDLPPAGTAPDGAMWIYKGGTAATMLYLGVAGAWTAVGGGGSTDESRVKTIASYRP